MTKEALPLMGGASSAFYPVQPEKQASNLA